MDNNNIKFLGYFDDGTFQKAAKQRENPIELESFYNVVNQATSSGCCSCCKREVIVYAILQRSLPIKSNVLSLCEDCICRLPAELDELNLYSNGTPPLLAYKINNSEV